MFSKTVWLYWGNKKMSFLRYMTFYSLRKLNPDFEINLVVPERKAAMEPRRGVELQDEHYYDGEDYTDRLADLNLNVLDARDVLDGIDISSMRGFQVSDVLAWRVLSTLGGIKADTDILFHRPIPYEVIKDVDVSLFEYRDINAVGFVFGTPNQLWADVLGEALCNVDNEGDQYTGPIPMTSAARRAAAGDYPGLNVVRFKNELIYPFVDTYEDWGDVCMSSWRTQDKLPTDNFGIHWYGGFPVSAHFNAILNERNFREHDCLVCRAIGDIYDECSL